MPEKYNREEHCGFGNPIWDFDETKHNNKKFNKNGKKKGRQN